jgi:hypothetical protein
VTVVVEGVVGVAAILTSVLAHWRRKRMTEASPQRRRRWGWRQQPTTPEFPARFLLGRDRRAPSGTTRRVSRA